MKKQLELVIDTKISDEMKKQLSQFINANIEKIKATGIKITGDKTLTLFEVYEYGNILSECLNEDIPVCIGTAVDNNLSPQKRKLEITIYDDKKDIDEDSYTIEV